MAMDKITQRECKGKGGVHEVDQGGARRVEVKMEKSYVNRGQERRNL